MANELVNEALSLADIRNERELINQALNEVEQTRRKKDLFHLAGAVELDKEYDYKTARVMRYDFD